MAIHEELIQRMRTVAEIETIDTSDIHQEVQSMFTFLPGRHEIKLGRLEELQVGLIYIGSRMTTFKIPLSEINFFLFWKEKYLLILKTTQSTFFLAVNIRNFADCFQWYSGDCRWLEKSCSSEYSTVSTENEQRWINSISKLRTS